MRDLQAALETVEIEKDIHAAALRLLLVAEQRQSSNARAAAAFACGERCDKTIIKVSFRILCAKGTGVAAIYLRQI